MSCIKPRSERLQEEAKIKVCMSIMWTMLSMVCLSWVPVAPVGYSVLFASGVLASLIGVVSSVGSAMRLFAAAKDWQRHEWSRVSSAFRPSSMSFGEEGD